MVETSSNHHSLAIEETRLAVSIVARNVVDNVGEASYFSDICRFATIVVTNLRVDAIALDELLNDV